MSTKIFKIESYNDSNEPAYIETKLSVEKLTILIRHVIGTLTHQDEKGEVVGVSLCLREMLYFLIPSKKLDVADDYEVLDVRALFDLENLSDGFWQHYEQFGVGVTYDDIFAAYDRVHAIYYPRCYKSKPCTYCLKSGYIPNWLSHFKYQLACNVSDGKAITWCTDFWEAIGAGVDIDKVERLDELKYRFLDSVIENLGIDYFPDRIERSGINPEVFNCTESLREAILSRASTERFSAIASYAKKVIDSEQSGSSYDTPWRTVSVIKFIAEKLTETKSDFKFLHDLVLEMADLEETRSRESRDDNPYSCPSADEIQWAYISEIDFWSFVLMRLLEET